MANMRASILSIACLRSTGQQIELLCRVSRHGEAEVAEALAAEHAAARRALKQALLNEIGLDHFLDDVALLGERGGKRLDPDRAAVVVLGDAVQEPAVLGVEPLPVDV